MIAKLHHPNQQHMILPKKTAEAENRCCKAINIVLMKAARM